MAGNYNYGGNGGYREWMYKRFDEVTGNLSAEYVAGVEEFMTFANSQPIVQSNRGKFHCPCSVCKNEKHMVSGRRVSSHLFSRGFMPDYYVWYRHGEELNMDIGTNYTDRTYQSENHEEVGYVVEDPYVDMVNDAFRYNVGFDDNYDQDGSYQNVEEPVRNHSNKFYDLLEGAQNPLYDGCREGQSQLSLAARLMQNKAEYNMSEKLVDSVCQMFTDFLPEGNQATGSHYQTEKLMRNLGTVQYHFEKIIGRRMKDMEEELGRPNVLDRLNELEADTSAVSDGASRPRELTTEEYTTIFLQSTERDARGNPYGIGSLKNTLGSGNRKYPGDSSSFQALEEQLKDAHRKIEEQVAYNERRESEVASREAEQARVAAEQKDKLEHLSLVEKYLRQTDPQFLHFMATHSSSAGTTEPIPQQDP
ncbi:unnamed protein product [Arabidopsis arenosa]|uniref:Transposase-associated domain-containing protein n=1 Tax=Arabidopsis arenosa TaxID=38785 RepID=A0A8S1ZMW1_ARAAE|nr:unnamed protein product [Arabidopsis arenosa]